MAPGGSSNPLSSSQSGNSNDLSGTSCGARPETVIETERAPSALKPATIRELFNAQRVVSERHGRDPALRDPRYNTEPKTRFYPQLFAKARERELIFSETLQPCRELKDILTRQAVIKSLSTHPRFEILRNEKQASFGIVDGIIGGLLAQVPCDEYGGTMCAMNLARRSGGPSNLVANARRMVDRGLQQIGSGLKALTHLISELELSESEYICSLATDLKAEKTTVNWPQDLQSIVATNGMSEEKLLQIAQRYYDFTARLGVLVEVSSCVREGLLSFVTCDHTLPPSYKQGWNIACPETRNHRNDSPAATRITLYSGDNMSGKTESGLKQNFFIQLLAQAWGVSSVDSGNIHLYDSFFYFDRAETDAAQGLSAYAREILTYRDSLPNLGTRVFGCIDEGGSTTSPEDQVLVLSHLVERPELSAARIFISSHNEELSQVFARHTDVAVYRFATNVSGSGALEFTYKLEPGIADSNSIAVAEKTKADEILVTKAKHARDGLLSLKCHGDLRDTELPPQKDRKLVANLVDSRHARPEFFESIIPSEDSETFDRRRKEQTAARLFSDDQDFDLSYRLALTGVKTWTRERSPIVEGRMDGRPNADGVKRLLLRGNSPDYSEALARQSMFIELSKKNSHVQLCDRLGRIEYVTKMMPWALKGIEALSRLPHSLNPFDSRYSAFPLNESIPIIRAYRDIVVLIGGNTDLQSKLDEILKLAALRDAALAELRSAKIGPLLDERPNALAVKAPPEVVTALQNLNSTLNDVIQNLPSEIPNPTLGDVEHALKRIVDQFYALHDHRQDTLYTNKDYRLLRDALEGLPRAPLKEEELERLNALLRESQTTTLGQHSIADLCDLDSSQRRSDPCDGDDNLGITLGEPDDDYDDFGETPKPPNRPSAVTSILSQLERILTFNHPVSAEIERQVLASANQATIQVAAPITASKIESFISEIVRGLCEEQGRKPVIHRSALESDLSKLKALAQPLLNRALERNKNIELDEWGSSDGLNLALFFQLFDDNDSSVTDLLNELREYTAPHISQLASSIEQRLTAILTPENRYDFDRFAFPPPPEQNPLKAATSRWSHLKVGLREILTPQRVALITDSLAAGELGPFHELIKEFYQPDYRAVAPRVRRVLLEQLGPQLRELELLEVEWAELTQSHPISANWSALRDLLSPDVISDRNGRWSFSRFWSHAGFEESANPLRRLSNEDLERDNWRLLKEIFTTHVYPSAIFVDLQRFGAAKAIFDAKVGAFFQKEGFSEPESPPDYPILMARRLLAHRGQEIVAKCLNHDKYGRRQLYEQFDEISTLSLIGHNLSTGDLCVVKFNSEGVYSVRAARNVLSFQQQIPQDLRLTSDGRLEFLNGPNMSGKTFRQKTAFMATLFAIHTGLAPAESATMPWFDHVLYMDRVVGKKHAGLSSGGEDFARWSAVLPEVRSGKRLFVCVDEAFSTMSPQYQRFFTGAGIAEINDYGHYGIVSTHNHQTIDWLSRLSTNIRPCYLRYTIDPATGGIEFERIPVQGHAKSEALAVARMLGFDLSASSP